MLQNNHKNENHRDLRQWKSVYLENFNNGYHENLTLAPSVSQVAELIDLFFRIFFLYV